MQLARLDTLRFIPHDHAIRLLVNEAFRRQVVPAADAKDCWDAKRARRANNVDLLRSEIQERRDEQEIRLLLAQEGRRCTV